MPELEFTGERVIQGLVDSNLFNEHLSRYRFAARFTDGKTVLDAGCGSGYGAAQFENAARVTAIDFAVDAVAHAKAHFGSSQIQFAQARCEAMPFANETFDVVIAFEVIEHLEDWRSLLREAHRVLRPEGVFFVSTPNKVYYSETRAKAGPNPFHVHEFEFAEFETALRQVFPEVRIWNQDHAEVIAFTTNSTAPGELAASGSSNPEQSHFYVAACGRGPLPELIPFAWIPAAGNVLREREHHIALLGSEVAQKSAWLAELEDRHFRLRDEHEAVVSELEQSNRWAEKLRDDVERGREVVAERDRELASRNHWIASLQGEVRELQAERESTQQNYAALDSKFQAELLELHRGYGDQVAALEEELEEVRKAYGANFDRQEAERASVHQGYQAKIAGMERDLAEVHTFYKAAIDNLEGDLAGARAEWRKAMDTIDLIGRSKWIQLGRKVGVGPKIE